MRLDKISKTKINNAIFDIVLYLILILLAVLMLYPLLFVLSASFSDPKAVAGGEMLLFPVRPTLDRIFQHTVLCFRGNHSESDSHTSLCLCRIQKRFKRAEIPDALFHDYDVFQRRNDPGIPQCEKSWSSQYEINRSGKRAGIHIQSDRCKNVFHDCNPVGNSGGICD